MAANGELATYLRDHRAGSAGGVELARRIAETSAAGEREDAEEVAKAIEEDIAKLDEVMDRLGVESSRLKRAGAWVGEKLGRGKLRASSPSGRVLQVESMIMGVTGKRHLWRSLARLAEAGEARLSADEMEAYAGRAEDQRRRLEKLHENAARALRGG
jgi:hypothetical protein